MPQIREYENPINKLQPSEIGAQAQARAGAHLIAAGAQASAALQRTGEQLGRGVGEAGATVGELYDANVVRPELSQGHLALAGLQDNLNHAWDDAEKANPNDRSIQGKYLENVDAQINDFKGKFQTKEGREWAEEAGNKLKEHLFTRSSASMARRDGEAAVANWAKTTNILSSQAAQHPETLDFQLSQLHDLGETTIREHHKLTSEQATNMRGELGSKGAKKIVQSAIGGLVNQGAYDAADALVKKYGDLGVIDGMEENRYIKTMRSAAKTEATSQRIETDRANKEAANQKYNEIMLKSFGDDGVVRFTPDIIKEIKDSAGVLTKGDGPQFAALLTKANAYVTKKPVTGDVGVFKDLMANVVNADPEKKTTEDQITQAHASEQINDKQYKDAWNTLKNWNADPHDAQFSDAMKAAQKRLDVQVPGTNFRDPLAADAFSSFMNSFMPEYKQLKHEGKLPVNALDMDNPESLIRQRLKASGGEHNVSDVIRAITAQNSNPGQTPAKMPGVPDGAPSGAFVDKADGKLKRYNEQGQLMLLTPPKKQSGSPDDDNATFQ